MIKEIKRIRGTQEDRARKRDRKREKERLRRERETKRVRGGWEAEGIFQMGM